MVTHVLESMNEVITNNYDQSHKAVDIVTSDRKETNVIALENGTVETVVKNIQGTNHKSKGLATYGNFVKIKQDNGKTALYAHMKYGSVKVNKGQYIEKGSVIGTVGETGNAYGKHLHLEIQNENNEKENPIVYLNSQVSKAADQNTISTQNQEKIVNQNTPENNQEKIVQNKSENTQDKSVNQDISENKRNPRVKQNQEENNYPSKETAAEEYLSAKNYYHGSIVDALKMINSDSSYNYRKQLAQKNGIQNYHGSYSQNVKMLNLLKQGKLKKV